MTMKQPVRPAPALRGREGEGERERERESESGHTHTQNQVSGGGTARACAWGTNGVCVSGVARRPPSPAVDHDGAGGRRVGDLDPADEGQQPRGMVRDPVVGPAREVELLDLPHLVEAALREEDQGPSHQTRFD